MWVPSFLWAKRKLIWNAGHIRIASNGSAPPWMRKPGAQPLWGGWTPCCSFPCGLQGPRLNVSQVLCAIVLSFLVTIQISPLVCFPCKLQQKSQHAYRLRTWSPGIFLEPHHFGKVLSQKFLIWLTFSRGGLELGDIIHTNEYSWGGSSWLSEAVSMALPCLLWHKSSFSSHMRFLYLLTLYFTAGILVCSCRISLFHSNNQQCEAVT